MLGFGWQDSQNPWHRLREMEREMNRLLTDYSGPRRASFPPVNIHSDGEGATVTAELSGVDPRELDISVQGRALVMHGERKAPADDQEGRWLRQERHFGRFSRHVDLGFEIDQDSVEASYRDGMLKLRLQRAEKDRPKQIVVQG